MKVVKVETAEVIKPSAKMRGLNLLMKALFPNVKTTDGKILVGKKSIHRNWEKISENDRKFLIEEGILEAPIPPPKINVELLQEGISLLHLAARDVQRAADMVNGPRHRFSLLEETMHRRGVKKFIMSFNCIRDATEGIEPREYVQVVEALVAYRHAVANLILAMTAHNINPQKLDTNAVTQYVDPIWSEAENSPTVLFNRNIAFRKMNPEDLKILTDLGYELQK